MEKNKRKFGTCIHLDEWQVEIPCRVIIAKTQEVLSCLKIYPPVRCIECRNLKACKQYATAKFGKCIGVEGFVKFVKSLENNLESE